MSIEDAETASQKLREFVYLVSHDLSAPLRGASSFSRILLNDYQDKLDQTGKEYLNLIASEASRAQAMLQGLLEYSRLDTMAKSVTTKFDSARILEHCKIVLEEPIKATGARFTAGPLPSIQADSEQFMQLLLYLFENAMKFAAPGIPPRIAFNGTDEHDHWHFTISDNGIGVDPAYREKAFVLFKQLHPQGNYSGIGMGLTLARKIVERHGGKIWLDDGMQDAGITVHFTLPKPH